MKYTLRTVHSNKYLTDTEKWMVAAKHISRIIPDCEELGWYVYLWEAYNMDTNIITEIKKQIKDKVEAWIEAYTAENKENEIVLTIKFLLPAVIPYIRQCVAPQYKSHFPKSLEELLHYSGLPRAFCAPNPFVVISDKDANLVLQKPFILKSYDGKTTLEIRGTALRSEDGQLAAALKSVLNKYRREVEITEKFIGFTTSYAEIALALEKSYPTHESTRNAIWKGCTRLNDSRMTLTNEKGRRTMGGILGGATELEEDSNFEIRIYLDVDFIMLYGEGFVRLDKSIALHSRPIVVNVYMWLLQRTEFNQFGILRPTSIFQIYKEAGLGGITPESKTKEYMRYVLKEVLRELKVREVITGKIIYNKDEVSITDKYPKKALEKQYK